jgi:nicotinamide phosphoribosyltransferase
MNIIMLSDSYKYAHYLQYPNNSQVTYSYYESRGGKFSHTVFFGLQYLIQQYLEQPITLNDIDEAETYATNHGLPFNRDGWLHIYYEHDGKLPITIKAVKEGSVIPTGNVLFTIENTDDECSWLTSFLETLLMKVWYPTTIATKSYYVRKMLEMYHQQSSDIVNVNFSYHNFGDRGSSSVESAGIGGIAHLTQFLGTDNFNSLAMAYQFYGVTLPNVAGYSIPASEHSTVTSWGEEHEFDMIAAYLEKSRGQKLIACVMDNLYDAVNYVTSSLKSKIESDEYPDFVIRPDSGDPMLIIPKIINIMEKNGVSYTTNSKGYKVFDHYRIIWGDGIDPTAINGILNMVISLGYSAENMAFGSGGDLMQNVNRDTMKFAIKCSAMKVNGEWRDVFKNPITDAGKRSKKGRLKLVKDGDTYKTITVTDGDFSGDLLETVYENGVVVRYQTLNDIRSLSREIVNNS